MILGANAAIINAQLELTSTNTAKRGLYVKLDDESGAKIGKYASKSARYTTCSEYEKC